MGDSSAGVTPTHSLMNNAVTKISMSSSRASYSQAAQYVNFPKKSQAIVTDAVEGITIKDYTVAVGKIIGPDNIRFVSRISQGRVCLYLSSDTLVNQLLQSHKKININNTVVEFRPLVSTAKRVILSNVCPIIPHSIIENKLAELNVSKTSQITFIRAGMSEPGYAHVLSFRRQVYIKPEDIEKLPSVMQIHFDNTVYWIYISTDKVSCFRCKEEGHLAKYCQNSELSEQADNSQESLNTTQQNNTQDSSHSSPIVDSPSTSNIQKETHQEEFKTPVQVGTKRAHSNSTYSNESNDNNEKNLSNDTQTDTSKKGNKSSKGKRLKNAITVSELETQLDPAREFLLLEETKENSLTYESIVKLLEKTYRNTDPHSTALTFTQDIPTLIETLKKTELLIVHKNLKNRISRLVKKLSDPKKEDTASEGLSSSEE